LAIQVHGGYGYTRDFPVEQYWRDNRLNMIHEGTHGIQAMDLLGRKVLLENGRGLLLLGARIQQSIVLAQSHASLQEHAKALGEALARVASATQKAWASMNPTLALANAVPYMQAFGHVVIAWLWLDVARRSLERDPPCARPASKGRAAAAAYFFRYELPRIHAWLPVVERCDQTCADVPEDAF
jgi:butyryl-CoA dehydrogenase